MLITLPYVQVGGMTYSINLINAFSSSRDNHHFGDNSYENSSIRIARLSCEGSERPLQVLEVTLLHELIHAVEAAHALEMDEDTVARLAHGLYQVLKQYGLQLIKESDDRV